jgi:hypothetical protein
MDRFRDCSSANVAKQTTTSVSTRGPAARLMYQGKWRKYKAPLAATPTRAAVAPKTNAVSKDRRKDAERYSRRAFERSRSVHIAAHAFSSQHPQHCLRAAILGASDCYGPTMSYPLSSTKYLIFPPAIVGVRCKQAFTMCCPCAPLAISKGRQNGKQFIAISGLVSVQFCTGCRSTY